ncbi:MAG: FAD-dependent oxidoreductase, partial [Bauldia sp.]|nr:FAD-dependent oxidoreductase [Bauldia sp.]
MSLIPTDLTPVLQATMQKGAGPQRWQRPTWVDHLPPCNSACPAGENIQAWLSLAREGNFEAAWRTLVSDNPMPAVHGRACYHPCETSCNRKDLDEAVLIHAVERFLGDLAAEKGWTVAPGPETGKKVLIVGAGPAGLSCAWHLRRLGHAVEIRDAMPEPGGMLHYGIPAYRLPRADLAKEVARIRAMGVTFTMNTKVDDIEGAVAAGGFDACFVAIGAQAGNHLDIPAADGSKMVDAIRLFEDVEAGRAPKLGRVVGIVGGGNTAMDAARVAKRLGAEEAIL